MLTLAGYSVEKCIHRTESSELYIARRDSDGVQVVLKSYVPGSAASRSETTQREYQALRLCQGRGVVSALELAFSGTRPVLVLKCVRGVSLLEWARARPLAWVDMLEMAAQFSEALGQVHAQRLIHRDIKPNNVLVDPRGTETTIIDLGLARPFGSGRHLPQTATFGGTPLYMAPEQTGRMNRGIDFRSDLYSLGATLYHALTGAPPFDTDDLLAVIHAHLARLPVPPHQRVPGMPATLSRIILKLLQKEPEDRYQSAHALRSDLLAVLEQLRQTGRIDDDFVLGRADLPLQPRFTKRLYGREAEIQILHAAYQRAASGTVEFALLSGAPGIGKSALMHELRDPLARTGGYLVFGKFDQYRRDLPYAAFVAAFDSLVHQLLAESEERLVAWRERLLQALGNVAGALVELVPNLGIVLGTVPLVPALGPKETQAQLALAVERFVRGCARAEHPLVLALDDLQWADAGSHYLLEGLLSEDRSSALLMLGAYRDTEVGAEHPLTELLERLERKGRRGTRVRVPPLSNEAAGQMLADVLGKPPAATQTLARLVALKTGNAPLLIQQFIQHVHDLGLLSFAPAEGWTWDDAAIALAKIPESAVDLMLARLAQLHPGEREVIQFASCVSDEFDGALVAELMDRQPSDLERELFSLAEQGLIAPSTAGYRFVHDRIREASQALLSAEARSELHHRIGLLLLERTPTEQWSDRCFEITDHLCQAGERLGEDERPRALRISVLAGQRALAAGVAATASRYLEHARGLFREGDWEGDPELAWALFWSLAEAAFQSKAFRAALDLLDALERRSLTRPQLVQVLAKRITLFTYCPEGDLPGEQVDATELTLATLRRFGVRWPRRPSVLRILWRIARTEWLLRGALDERLFPRQGSVDADWMAPLHIAQAGVAALARDSGSLMLFPAAQALREQSRHGITLGPGISLAHYATGRIIAFNTPRGVERLARAAADWLQKASNPQMSVRGQFALQSFVFSWIRPRHDVLAALQNVGEAAREVGDLEYVTYTMQIRADYAGLFGESLDRVIRAHEVLIQRENNQTGVLYTECFMRMLRLLQDAENEGDDNWQVELQDQEQKVRQTHLRTSTFWITWMSVLCVLGQYEEASRIGEKIPKIVRHSPSGSAVVDYTLYRGLCAAVRAGSRTGQAHRQQRRIVRACARRLRRWARYGPDFMHMALLLDTELARLRGDSRNAIRLSKESARRAEQQGYPHHIALLAERRADLLRAERRTTEAQAALDEARKWYGVWGAAAKARALQESDRPNMRSSPRTRALR